MLKDYPVLFNEEPICTPTAWSESYEVIENVNETEAGTEQISVTRYGKLTVSASFQCTSLWMGRFKAYSQQDTISVSLYDAEFDGYEVRTMRLRKFKAALKENSHRTARTNGLWTVSFALEEF